MNIEFLYYFCMLAQTKHYGRAAELLSITQPGLTYAINELEKELGVPLFVRVGRNIELTESGRIYYTRITNILDQLDAAKLEASAAQNSTRASCIVGGISVSAISLLLNAYRETVSYDTEKLILVEHMDAHTAARKLNLDQIDYALIAEPLQSFKYEYLSVRGPDIVAIVPRNHPLSNKKSVCLKDAAQHYPFIWNINKTSKAAKCIEQRFMDAGIHPNIVARVNNFFTVAQMVANNAGIACVMDIPSLPMYPVVRLPIEDFESLLNFYLVRKKDAVRSEIAESFWEFCKTQH